MILLPVYAILIWCVIAYFRRRWQAFAIVALSVFPVILITHLCIQYIPLRAGEPRPSWLYAISASYALLIFGIGLVIAVQHNARTANDCHACGYDLTGTAARACPECGTTVRCRKCHRDLHDADRRCPVCLTLVPTFQPVDRETDLPKPAREQPSVLARHYARRLRGWGGSIASEARHAQRDHEPHADQTDRAAHLRRAG